MEVSNKSSYWVLKSVSKEDITYKSNDGYNDEINIKYVYDDSVANHKQISSGDVAILVDKKRVLAVVKISKVVIFNGTKVRRRCPVCRSTNYEDRKTKLPRYRCNHGHEFTETDSEIVDVTNYEAYYSKSFMVPEVLITIDKLKPYYNKGYNRNMSMQRLDSTFFEVYYNNELQSLNSNFTHSTTEENENYLSEYFDEGYIPVDKDERTEIMRSIMQRRGQESFRKALRDYYGDKCVITGCELLPIVEAAHISPYRGEKDHHVTNGLLLRADIHTMFDLNLVGIDPVSLKIHLSENVFAHGYDELDGKLLHLEKDRGPSRNALISRWKDFLGPKKL